MSTEILAARLSAEPITVEEATAAVESAECGAVVTFSGVVRNHDGGRGVASLSYSGHPTAEQVMTEVVEDLVRELGPATLRVWAAHRVGPLEVGDAALVCAVAAPHRQLAFTACAELVDRIKDRVPIWKEQFFADGTIEWVGAGQPGKSA